MRDPLVAAVEMLESGWPQRFSEEQAAVYLDGLADLDPKVLLATVKRLVRTEEYRPSIASIRREVAMDGLPSERDALRQAHAYLRWAEARRFVNGSGFDPVRPDVHDAVVETCFGLSVARPGWEERFVTKWRSLGG
jgi:hypothetical protein